MARDITLEQHRKEVENLRVQLLAANNTIDRLNVKVIDLEERVDRVDERVGVINDKTIYLDKAFSVFVERMGPVKTIVYAAAGSILMAFLTALFTVVIVTSR